MEGAGIYTYCPQQKFPLKCLEYNWFNKQNKSVAYYYRVQTKSCTKNKRIDNCAGEKFDILVLDVPNKETSLTDNHD